MIADGCWHSIWYLLRWISQTAGYTETGLLMIRSYVTDSGWSG